MNWNILKWNSNIFNTPCHLNNWKKSYHLLSRVSWWKEFEFMEIINAKMKVWESPFIPSHLTFKKFQIHSLSVNQSHNKQTINSNLSIYYNILKFRILGCYMFSIYKQLLVSHNQPYLLPTTYRRPWNNLAWRPLPVPSTPSLWCFVQCTGIYTEEIMSNMASCKKASSTAMMIVTAQCTRWGWLW